MKIKNQAGIISVILVALLAFSITGLAFYVWQQQNRVTSTPEPKVVTTKPADATAGWKTHFEARFSLKYNPKWESMTCPEVAGFYLAANKEALPVCQSDKGSQIAVTAVSGDQRAQSMGNYSFEDIQSKQAVTVDGVAGTRTASVQKPDQECPCPPVGTKYITYAFYANGWTYIASYQQQPTGDYATDISKDFDIMIKQTLKFR